MRNNITAGVRARNREIDSRTIAGPGQRDPARYVEAGIASQRECIRTRYGLRCSKTGRRTKQPDLQRPGRGRHSTQFHGSRCVSVIDQNCRRTGGIGVGRAQGTIQLDKAPAAVNPDLAATGIDRIVVPLVNTQT